jgi:hypothetical protein
MSLRVLQYMQSVVCSAKGAPQLLQFAMMFTSFPVEVPFLHPGLYTEVYHETG